MKKLSFQLSGHLLIREEGEHAYLYHRRNDAVLKMPIFVLQELLKGTLSDNEESRQMLQILNDNRMLDYQDEQPMVLSTKSGESHGGQYSTLFGLKSLSNPFLALWAITSRCNLRCIYCFPDVKSVQPTFRALPEADLMKIADQIIAAKIFQVTISGGEAILEKNVWKVLERLHANNVKVCLISNGTTMTSTIIERLKKYEVFCAVSLDAASEAVNAITRGPGVFGKVVKSLKALKEAGLPVIVLVTVNRHNFPQLPELVNFLSTLGICHITLQDLRPFGTKACYDSHRLTYAQEKQLYEVVSKMQVDHPEVFFNLTELFMFPHPQMPKIKKGKIMQCPAGHNMVYIDFYGDLYPCTNLPTMKMGNLITDGSITELWRHSKTIKKLRALKSESILKIKGCGQCEHHAYCDGGCRGDALFSHQDLYAVASRCPIYMEKEYASST